MIDPTIGSPPASRRRDMDISKIPAPELPENDIQKSVPVPKSKIRDPDNIPAPRSEFRNTGSHNNSRSEFRNTESYNNSRSVFKNTTILMASNILSKALGALIIILLARHLTPAGFGEYSFAFAFAAVFIIISDFGLDALVIRDVSRDKRLGGIYLEKIGILRSGLSGMMILAALTAGYLMGIGQDGLLIILFAGCIYAFDKMSGLSFALFRAHEKMGYEAVSQVAWRVVQLMILLAVMQLGYPLLEVVLALLVASVIKTIISFTLVLQMGVRPERGGERSVNGDGDGTRGGDELKEGNEGYEKDRDISLLDMMKLSKGFAAYEIIQALYANMIIILLYMYVSFEEIGWFSASLKVFLLLLLIPASFETAIFPVLARLHHEHPDHLKKAYAKTMKFSLLLAIPATFIIFTFAEPIVGILGRDFETSSALLMLLIFALPLRTLNMIMKTTLWSADRTDITVVNILISTVALALATIYLIREFGLTGAVYGFICGEGVLLTLNYYFISKKIYKIGRYIWKPIMSGCAMSGAIYFMFMITEGGMNDLSLLMMALAVYILMIQALKTITPKDIRTIKMGLGRSGGKAR